MMPLRLNLLSPEKRALIERLVYAQFTRNTVELFVFILAIVGIMFLGGNWFLEDHLNDLSMNLTLVSHEQVKKNTRIQSINTILLRTDVLQKQYTMWSQIIPPLTNAIPKNIILKNMTIDIPGKTITLAGTAQTRNDLLLLQTELQKLPLIASVTIPLDQLTSKEHPSFSLLVLMK